MVTHQEAGRRGGLVTAAKRAAEGNTPRPKAEPRQCLCGCGNLTGGGTFRMGHDARFKSMLIKGVLNQEPVEALTTYTPDEAYDVLEERDWLKFLEKSRTVAQTPKPQRRREKEEMDAEHATATLATIQQMKDVARRLKDVGRYSGANKIEVTRSNCATLLSMTDEELIDWEAS